MSSELHNSSRFSPSLRALSMSRACWSEENDLRATEDACLPAAVPLAAGRRFGRALLRDVGVALLIAMVPLQAHAQNARPNGLATLDRTAHVGDQPPRDGQGPFAPPLSGLLTGADGLEDAAQQRANAAALAYVVSPPPATRGMLPRYLPAISLKDAQPIPALAAAAPQPRHASRHAGRLRRSHGRQCRLRQGARRFLAEFSHPFHTQRAASCRHERSARRLRLHRHRLCPRQCGAGSDAIPPRRRPTPPRAAKAPS